MQCIVCGERARFREENAPDRLFCGNECYESACARDRQRGGPAWFDIERETEQNTLYGPVVLYEDDHIQVALMSVPPGGRVPVETHAALSQFFRVESGNGEIRNGQKTWRLYPGASSVVPAGTPHEIRNTSDARPLKFYTIYAKGARDAFAH